MASGDHLFTLMAQAGVPPGSNSATPDYIEDGSTPTILIPCLDFDGAADEHIHWFVEIPSQYSETTGFTFSYKYAVDGSDTDLVEMEFRVLPFADLDVLTGDLGMDGQTPVAIQDTPPATPANKFNETTTGALAKASFGSVGPGTLICIRGTRDVSAATNTDDLQLISVRVVET